MTNFNVVVLSRLAQRGFRSGPRWERYLSKEKAPSSEVPSVFYRFSAEKGVEHVIFTQFL